MKGTKGSVFFEKNGCKSSHYEGKKRGKILIPKVFCHRSPGSVSLFYFQICVVGELPIIPGQGQFWL